MQQPPRTADSHSATHKNSVVDHRIHTTRSRATEWRHSNLNFFSSLWILSSCLHLGPASNLLLSGFATTVLREFLLFPMHATCCAHRDMPINIHFYAATSKSVKTVGPHTSKMYDACLPCKGTVIVVDTFDSRCRLTESAAMTGW